MNQDSAQKVTQVLTESEAYLERLQKQLEAQQEIRNAREMTEVDAQIDAHYGMRDMLREQSLQTLQAEGFIAEQPKAPVKKAKRMHSFI